MSMHIQILKSTEREVGTKKLCFQWCRYLSETEIAHGYRFIWKDASGKLLAHRGQAAIPSIRIANELIETATKEGWGSYEEAAPQLS